MSVLCNRSFVSPSADFDKSLQSCHNDMTNLTSKPDFSTLFISQCSRRAWINFHGQFELRAQLLSSVGGAGAVVGFR